MIKKIIIQGFLLLGTYSFAQRTAIYTASDQDFREATEVYHNQSYQFAQDRYQEIATNHSKPQDVREISQFYVSLCAVKLRQKGALARFETFANSHPEKDYVQEAYQDLGDYFYGRGDYKNALLYYDKTNPKLIRGKKDEYAFRVGYAAFSQHEYDKALHAFKQVSNRSKLTEDAKYFSGHILYQQEKAEKARKLFNELKDSDQYKDKVRPYLLQTAYKSSDYEEAIEEGKEILASTDQSGVQEKEAQKIVGESYFNQQNYKEAIPYLEEYTNSGVILTPTDYYQLGFSYDETGNYSKAIENYNKIVAGKDEMAQKAYYQLGHSYVKEGQKNEALNAFKSAAELDFDAKIQEDALYNYAKLSYEIGNPHKTVPEALNEYLVVYPNSNHTDEIHKMLVNSYQNLGDYAQAYDVLKTKIVPENPSLKPLEAQIGYQYGVQLFKKGNDAKAEMIFSEVAQLPLKSSYSAKSVYWKGQAQYRQGNYKGALKTLNDFQSLGLQSSENDRVDYNKGYLYFKLGDYKNAATYFKSYVNQAKDSNYRKDAQLRLADSYYASAQFWPSLEEYQKVVDANHAQKDYAAFQKGMVYGLVNREAEKQAQLESFLKEYPKSDYYDDGMYQLASTYFKAGDKEKAIQLFTKMQNDFPASELVPFAELKKAQIYYNNDQSEEALEAYKNIVQAFPNTSAAQESVLGVKKIYTENAQIGEYEKWVKNIGVEVDQDELMRLNYEVAEKQFHEKKYDQAEKLFEEFITKYPSSVNSTNAYYYKGESAYQSNKIEKAISAFEKIKNDNKYSEQAYLRLSQMYMKKENKELALNSLLKLNEISEKEAYQNFATVGIMRIYHLNGEDEKAFPYAEKVLENKQASASAKEDAQLIIARNLVKTNLDEALKYYEKLNQSEKENIKAEVLYYKAQNLANKKAYTKSNDAIFELASQYGAEAEWTAKALLIMADNYRALEDPYQANYTLETIIETYPEMTDIVNQAKAKQKLIKK
ncbi:hypothetical protein UJ101_02110 [Flavobacteriaceae bacterium UJ101]|nr:hypothetical protein UJ101_02110 [Flavobacteriaceae bacterium UJ101]